MKIAILTPTFNYYSGTDRVAQERAEYYSNNGNDVTVFALEAKIKPKGYKIVELGKPKSAFLERVYRLFPIFLIRNDYIKKLKGYDIVISFLYPMDALAYHAKKKYKSKYIAWVCGNAPGENLIEKIYMRIYRFFYTKYLKKADKIVCVSNTVKNELIKSSIIDIKKIKVEYNKIDKSRFNKNVKKLNLNKVNQIIKEYNLQNKKVFLYVGRLATSKRVDLLIKIFKMEKNEHPEYKLIIVGKPTFKRYFKKLLSMADEDVIFTGFVDDKELPAYYAVSNVYITASRDEGFNLPAVEAQACGIPVVAFDVRANKEIVKKGTLVPDGDIQGFTNAMNGYANSIGRSKRQFI